jgi:hypothetical protein
MGRRTPTPPLRNYAPASSLDNLDIDFDQGSTCVIRTQTADMAPTPQVQTHFADWKPRESSSLADAEAMSPVIDLDAALGPFNTPSLGPHFRNALDRASSWVNEQCTAVGQQEDLSDPVCITIDELKVHLKWLLLILCILVYSV